MKRVILTVVVCLCVLPIATAEQKKEYKEGLVAHYYRDAENWNGNWPDNRSTPTVPPEKWTFSNYAYSRVEPLINHQFIRRGWFSVRWQGILDTSPAGGRDVTTVYKFAIWADDGCRLYIDGQKLIDDWRACPEDSADAVREAVVILSPGKHSIVVEYFQGQSLQKGDRDPMKLYWECEERNIPRQIIPAAHFFHTDADLVPAAGRLD
jgi:hypothetical protein